MAKLCQVLGLGAMRLCVAIALPRSYGRVSRSGAGRCRSFFENPARVLHTAVPFIVAQGYPLSRRLHQDVDGEPLWAPLMRLSSQLPGNRAGDHVGRALGNRRHIWWMAPSVLFPAPWVGGTLPACECSAWQHIRPT